jgi:hypothetical protein
MVRAPIMAAEMTILEIWLGFDIAALQPDDAQKCAVFVYRMIGMLALFPSEQRSE